MSLRYCICWQRYYSPWSWDSCRRITGEGEVGLGGMVVMIGALEITADAGMCVVSWSLLEIDGSSDDNRHKTLIRSFICVVYCMDYCSPTETTDSQTV